MFLRGGCRFVFNTGVCLQVNPVNQNTFQIWNLNRKGWVRPTFHAGCLTARRVTSFNGLGWGVGMCHRGIDPAPCTWVSDAPDWLAKSFKVLSFLNNLPIFERIPWSLDDNEIQSLSYMFENYASAGEKRSRCAHPSQKRGCHGYRRTLLIKI